MLRGQRRRRMGRMLAHDDCCGAPVGTKRCASVSARWSSTRGLWRRCSAGNSGSEGSSAMERPRAAAQTESRRSLYEELAEQSLRFLESLVRQQHRFGFADRVRDEALLIESVHAAQIKSF